MMRRIFRPIPLFVSLLVAGLLSGCGFTPMHGATGATAPLANVNIVLQKGTSVVDNQAGFFVLQRMRDRVGKAADTAPHILEINPSYYRFSFGLTNSDVASRYDITVRADWTLKDSKTGETLERGRSDSVVTFGAPSGPYGVITADNVGVEQAAKQTADKLITELAKYYQSQAS